MVYKGDGLENQEVAISSPWENIPVERTSQFSTKSRAKYATVTAEGDVRFTKAVGKYVPVHFELGECD